MSKSNGKTSRIVKKTLAAVLSLAMVVSSLAVTGTGSDAAKKGKVKKVKVTSPVVNGGKLVLKKGQKKRIKVKVTTSKKSVSKKVTYKTSNKKVAKIVKSKGKVYVKAVGKKGKTAKITIISKANKKKKATLKIKIGTPIKKLSAPTYTETRTLVDNKKLTELKKTQVAAKKMTVDQATKQCTKVTKTTKKVSKKAITIYTGIKDQANDTQTSITYKIGLKYSPKKPTIKSLKWKTNKKSLLMVTPKGVISAKEKKGTAKLYGYAKDGSGKKITLTVNIEKSPVGATPTPHYENETREKTIVEDFESYDVGYNWESDDYKGTSGKATKGIEYVNANCGKMTVVKDPEDPNNKVLKIEYNGDTQAYDYAPIFNFKLSKAMKNYSAVQVQSRVVSNSSDCKYKSAVAYFDKYDKITPDYYFDTELTEADATQKKIDKKLLRFSVDTPMAKGRDEKFNVKKGQKFEGMEYNNKSFPMFYDAWSTNKIDANRTVGYKEKETDPACGWHQNTLEFQMTEINNADATLIEQKNIAMVLGSTYSGKYTGGQYTTLYLDNVAFLEGEIPCTAMTVEPAAKEVAVGLHTSITAETDITFTPANTTQKEIVWTSSDESVAKIDASSSNPKIYGLKAGTVKITAALKANPAIKAEYNLTVVEPKAATTDLVVDLTKLVPTKKQEEIDAEDAKADKDKAKIFTFSNIEPKLENGVLNIPFKEANNEQVVIDLGAGGVDLTQYKGVAIDGEATDQVTFELYPEETNFTTDKYWEKKVEWKTYPFFEGSCLNRSYEGTNNGGYGRETVWCNWTNDGKYKNPETKEFEESITIHGSLRHVRWIMLKANKYNTSEPSHTFKIYGITFKKDAYVNDRPNDEELGLKK